LCGNGVVGVPGEFFVFRTGAENRFPTYTPIKNIYRRNTSMVARALLTDPDFRSALRDLFPQQMPRKKCELMGVSTRWVEVVNPKHSR